MAIEFTTFRNQAQTRQGVLAYVRVSSEEQADRRASLEEQKRRIKEHFEGRLGLKILGWYADEGASAYKDDERREQFWAMIERAKQDPEVGVIAVDEESRFYRNRYKAAAVKGELAEYGVYVQTVNRAIDPRTMAGVMVESVEEAMAQAHSMMIRDYTLRGMAGNVQQRDPKTGWAFKSGGAAPFGWRNVRIELGADGKGRRIYRTIWELDPEWASIRHQILTWRMEGWSYDQIRDELNRRGVPSPRGGPWSQTSIHAVCREDMVWTAAGYTVWNKHYRKNKPIGQKWKPSQDWIVVPNAHPAIITEEEARRIIAVGKDRRRRWESTRGNERRSTYLLSGDGMDGGPLFVCLACGSRMVGTRPGRGRRKYICGTYNRQGRMGCTPVWVDAERLEASLLDYIRQHLFSEEYILSLIRASNAVIAEEARQRPQTSLDKRLKEIDRKLTQIKRAILAGDDPEGWVDELKALREERATVEAALAAEEAETEPTSLNKPIPESAAAEIYARYSHALQTGAPEELRQFVRAFLLRAVLDPAKRRVSAEFAPNWLTDQYSADVVPPTGRVIGARRMSFSVPPRR